MKFPNININNNSEIEAIKQILVDKNIATTKEISDKITVINEAKAISDKITVIKESK